MACNGGENSQVTIADDGDENGGHSRMIVMRRWSLSRMMLMIVRILVVAHHPGYSTVSSPFPSSFSSLFPVSPFLSPIALSLSLVPSHSVS